MNDDEPPRFRSLFPFLSFAFPLDALGFNGSGCPDVGGSRCREGEDSSASLRCTGHNLDTSALKRGVGFSPRFSMDIMEFYGIWIDAKFWTSANSRLLLGMISQFMANSLCHIHMASFRPKIGEIYYCSIIRSQKKLQFKPGACQF